MPRLLPTPPHSVIRVRSVVLGWLNAYVPDARGSVDLDVSLISSHKQLSVIITGVVLDERDKVDLHTLAQQAAPKGVTVQIVYFK